MENNEYVDFLVFGGLGVIEIKATKMGLKSLIFVDSLTGDTKPNIFTKKCKIQLLEYFNGERKEFDVALNLEGTEFQIKVWTEIMKIPFGETCTYSDIATKIGMKKSTKAIGSANACNKFSIVIPCHRVVGCDNKLKGYVYGLWRKEWLLKHEGCKDQLFQHSKISFLR